MIAIFLIESELQLIIVSSLLKKNDIIIDISLEIDQDYINNILKNKQVIYYKSSKVSRRNYFQILLTLRKIISNKTYELYTYSDECLYFRCMKILSRQVKVNLIENGEKTYIGKRKKRPLSFYLGNIIDYLIAILAFKKIRIPYASNNINQVVGLLPTNAYNIKHKRIDKNLCIWPNRRQLYSANVICIGLLRHSKYKEKIIENINAKIKKSTDEIYIKFHQRESQSVINQIIGKYRIINSNHSMESYLYSSESLKVILNNKNSIYYYAGIFDVTVKLIDE